jgi:hypothetical protein
MRLFFLAYFDWMFQQPINQHFSLCFLRKCIKQLKRGKVVILIQTKWKRNQKRLKKQCLCRVFSSLSYILGLPSVQNKQEPEKGPKWTDESKLEDILKVEYQEKKLDEFLKSHCDILLKNGLKYLEQWKDLTEKDKDSICMKPVDPIPIPLRKLLDKVQGTLCNSSSFYRY